MKLLILVSHLVFVVFVICATEAVNAKNNSSVQHIYYVAKTGSDKAAGTLEQPFLTIQKASNVMKAGDTCLIREGVYRETVRPVCSGTSELPIKFEAYNGEMVIISGTDVYAGKWEKYKGAIYKSSTKIKFVQLFVDGVMMNEARWPNMAVNNFFDLKSRAEMDNGDTLNIYDTDLPPGDWTGAIVNVLPAWEWIIFTRKIIDYIPGKSLMFDQPSPHAGESGNKKGTIADPETCYRPRKGNPYYIFGALAGLDIPTEWFLDTKTGNVYLWAPDSESPENHIIEIKQRGYAFDLGYKSNITIKGINIFAAAIKMEGTHCVVDGCTARYVNHFREQPIIHYWPLGTPNLMAGSYNQWRNSEIIYSADDGIKVNGDHHKITNCLIHEVGYTGVYSACINANKDKGAKVGTSYCEFSHNTLFNSGRFILFYNQMKNTSVIYNNMFNAGLLTFDAGITYGSWNETSQNVFGYNWVHGQLRPAGAGLYLDERTYPNTLHHNLVWDCIFSLQVNINENNLLPENSGTCFYNNTVVITHNPYGDAACFVNNGDNVKWINNIAIPGPGKTWRRDTWDFWKVRDWWFAAHLKKPEDGFARINEVDKNNYAYPLDTYFRLPKDSPGIDAGNFLQPYTDNYAGNAPDIGAYEYNGHYWLPGSTLDTNSIFSYLPGSPSPIENTFPHNGQRGVSKSLSSIELTFVPRMDANSFGGVKISDGMNFDKPKGDGTRKIILPIDGFLKGNTTYTVTVPMTIKPVEGVNILDREYVLTFTTE